MITKTLFGLSTSTTKTYNIKVDMRPYTYMRIMWYSDIIFNYIFDILIDATWQQLIIKYLKQS